MKVLISITPKGSQPNQPSQFYACDLDKISEVIESYPDCLFMIQLLPSFVSSQAKSKGFEKPKPNV